MLYASLKFQVSLIICLSLSVAEGNPVNTSIISDIIHYVKPFIQSLQLRSDPVHVRSSENTPENTINEKVKQLAPYLQDSDKKNIEGDEQSIVAYNPRATNDNNTNENYNKNELIKFKTMRNQIKLALEEETSNKTKEYVIKMLDDLIETLFYKQCPNMVFRKTDIKKILRKMDETIESILSIITFRQDGCYLGNKIKIHDEICQTIREPFRNCSIHGTKISEEECRTILNTFMLNNTCVVNNKIVSYSECDKVKDYFEDKINVELYDIVHNKFKQMYPPNTVISDLHTIFNAIILNYIRNSKKGKYALRCSLVDTSQDRKKHLRDADVCQHFRVCSEELKEFLTVFYRSLNDTAVRTFRNYAAMYEQDVGGDESDEKNSVILAIKQASDRVERRVAKIFMKTTSTFTLDPNKDRDNNIATLRHFVKQAIKQLNKMINNNMENDLKSLRTRLLLSIKNDIQHNLAADLVSFENDVVKQICSFFVTCKGGMQMFREETRRKHTMPRNKTTNSIIARVEVTLDDDLKENIISSKKGALRQVNVVNMRNQFGESKNATYTSNIKTTRARIRSEYELKTTRNMEIDTTVTDDSDTEESDSDSDFERTNIILNN